MTQKQLNSKDYFCDHIAKKEMTKGIKEVEDRIRKKQVKVVKTKGK